MTSAHETLCRADHVLLDFDGPVCAVFAAVTDSQVADALRTGFAEQGRTLPEVLATATDPFDMLTYAAEISPQLARVVEAEFSRWEQRAVVEAPPTPGVRDVLAWMTNTRRTVTIVSNNATSAVETYLRHAGLEEFVTGISARQPNDVTRLKPHPHLLQEAIAARDAQPRRCVMIGDSASDIQAAHVAGMPSIAFANKQGKYDTLAQDMPEAAISHMAELLPG